MSRRQFSDFVLRDYHRSHLSQTAEEIAEALQIPLHTLLERARRAGIVLSREPTPLQIDRQRRAEQAWNLSIAAKQDTYHKVAQNITLATSSDCCGVWDVGFREPNWGYKTQAMPGDRCRFSEKWLSQSKPKHPDRLGTITGVGGSYGCWRVRWDGCKVPDSYHKDFLEIIYEPLS